MKEFVDASMFLGMNNKDEKIRIACKNYFVEKLKNGTMVFMSLEQVGICDKFIWSLPREKQDEYYPFMDNLHTEVKFKRIAYSERDILQGEWNSRLNFTEKLTLGMVSSKRGILYTVNRRLLGLSLPFVKSLKKQNKELYFPKNLEKLYRKSLFVRL